ncbi:papain-like cysteine protease family protein [Owenweeksia hongkongensis]|uniref:papain-like cysteine protease family protein n=1 Tax=Owenweeksia hongkongensis TaxID=253245 RepID=UPI003A90BFBE
MRKLVILLTMFIGSMALSSCCTPEVVGSVPNTLRDQETNNWCWAATTQMLAEHFDISVKQCDLANHRFGETDCCDPANEGSSCPKNSDCNRPGWLELDFAGLTFSETTTALSWDNLKKQIYCKKKPMGYAYGTPGVVGHVLVVKGYITVAGTDYVILNDPWSPCVGEERLITYSQYLDPAGSSTHWRTWYDLAKKP